MPQVWVQFRSLFVPFNSCAHMHTQKKIIVLLKYMVWFSNGINSFCVTKYYYWFTTLVSSQPGIPRADCVAGWKALEWGVLGWYSSFFFFFFRRILNLWIVLNSVELILFICWQNLTLQLAGSTRSQTGQLMGSRCPFCFYNCKKLIFRLKCNNLRGNIWLTKPHS